MLDSLTSFELDKKWILFMPHSDRFVFPRSSYLTDCIHLLRQLGSQLCSFTVSLKKCHRNDFFLAMLSIALLTISIMIMANLMSFRFLFIAIVLIVSPIDVHSSMYGRHSVTSQHCLVWNSRNAR